MKLIIYTLIGILIFLGGRALLRNHRDNQRLECYSQAAREARTAPQPVMQYHVDVQRCNIRFNYVQ